MLSRNVFQERTSPGGGSTQTAITTATLGSERFPSTSSVDCDRVGAGEGGRRKKADDDDHDDADSPIVIRTTERKLRLAEEMILDIQNLNEIPASFMQHNVIVGMIVTCQAIALFFVAVLMSDLRPWYTNFYSFGVVGEDLDDEKPLSSEIAQINVLWYGPIFMLSNGLLHLVCVIFQEQYEWYLARHQNPFRWTEYSFSASLMKVLIAQQVGISDIHLLFAIFMLMVMVIQSGATHEALNAKARADGFPQNWRPYFQAWIAQLSGWLIVVHYFLQNAHAGEYQQPGAAYMWTILIVTFLLDTSFAIVFALQWHMIGPFQDYIVGEEGFMILSCIAKSALAWLSVAKAFD